MPGGGTPMSADNGRYDLCVVGAGYAGLNALFVASQYLPSSARVLILDRHQHPGGMWNDAYSYVRLHQPHRMFTAGNIPWTLGRERSYLATRDEVAAHLRHCFEVISQRFDVDARWGWEYVGASEEEESVVVSARDSDGTAHTFRADRLIEATGFNVEANTPLPVSSQQVRSIAPCGLEEAGLLGREHSEPVWVVGSGKTAIDTIVALAQANPGRTIGMVTGAGSFFFNRDLITPTGLKRWTGGVVYGSIFEQAAARFDGTNAAEVIEWCRTRYGISTLENPVPKHFLLAFLSEREAAVVANGVTEVIRDHLTDVVDDAEGPVLVLSDGTRHPITSGSWIVNCTGHLTPRDQRYVPYVSPSGRSMSINLTSTVFGPTAVAAYFLSHLFFLEKLVDAPFYELDMNALGRNAPEAVLPVWSAHIQHNLSVVMERVPMKVFQNFKLDFSQWYPLPRQIPGLVRMMRNHKRNRPRHRRTLDAFGRHAHVRCGPLSAGTPEAAADTADREPVGGDVKS